MSKSNFAIVICVACSLLLHVDFHCSLTPCPTDLPSLLVASRPELWKGFIP